MTNQTNVFVSVKAVFPNKMLFLEILLQSDALIFNFCIVFHLMGNTFVDQRLLSAIKALGSALVLLIKVIYKLIKGIDITANVTTDQTFLCVFHSNQTFRQCLDEREERNQFY